MQQVQGLQQQADAGEIPGVPMTEVPTGEAADGRSEAPGSVADAVVDSVVKTGEAIGNAVAQAKDAAAAAVGKASSFLQDKLKSFGAARQQAEL